MTTSIGGNRTGHYYKPNKTGRAWYIRVDGIEPVNFGQAINVVRRDGRIDTVTVTSVVSQMGDTWVCMFSRTEDKHATQVPQVPSIDATQFLNGKPDFIVMDDIEPDTPQGAPQAPVAPVAIPGEVDLAAAIAGALQAQSNKAAKALEARINKAIEDLRSKVEQVQASPKSAVITIKDRPPVTIEGHRHPMFEKVLRLATAGLNVLLVGEAGCGKTYLAHQIAQAMAKRRYGTVHCTAGMSESHVSGWLLPTGEAGRFEYHPAEFVRAYEDGDSLFLLDEIDAADPNVLMFLNGALANGILHIPHRLQGSEVKRGENVTIMAAANTYGHGANSKYQGRNALDGATLDRFYVVEMDYDAGREGAMFGKAVRNAPWEASDEATAHDISMMGEWVLSLRERTRKAQLRRIVSSRTLDKALVALRAGVPAAEVRKDTLAGWTADELNRVSESR